MNEEQIQSAISSKVICLVKEIMQQGGNSEDEAYASFMDMELYGLLTAVETRMYLEPIEYIYECYQIEKGQRKEELFKYVSTL